MNGSFKENVRSVNEVEIQNAYFIAGIRIMFSCPVSSKMQSI